MRAHLLFYKSTFAWPRASGHDVHTYHMMRALSGLGVRISLATAAAPPPAAIEGIPFESMTVLPTETGAVGGTPVGFGRLAERYRRYWGIPVDAVRAIGRLSEDLAVDAVIVAGLNVLPLLGAVRRAVRVWYAADELAWHHLSQVQAGDRSSWVHVREAAIKGAYERAFRCHVDRAWVVSSADRTAMRHVAGIRDVDLVPNGVDTDAYRPGNQPETPDTAVFWGRLDFGPNEQAMEWFCRHVWPGLRRARPAARFTMIGFNPTARVRALARLDGVELLPDVPDIRPEVATRAVVVMPFVSGWGIKNKLLEAAAMGKPIVCTPRALNGLLGNPSLQVAVSTEDWQRAVLAYWTDPLVARENGREARRWVERHHTWAAAAKAVLPGLMRCDWAPEALSAGQTRLSMPH